MKIGIDIDDTLTDTFDYMLPFISEFYKVDINYLKENDISYNTLTNDMKEKQIEFALKYFDTIAPNTPFKKDASEYIKKIKDLGHKIIIITARDKTIFKDEYASTYKELENGNIIYDKVICDFDKVKVCKEEEIDLFIDDSINNCESIQKLGIKVLLFNSKINQKANTNLPRVNTWKEVYEILKK